MVNYWPSISLWGSVKKKKKKKKGGTARKRSICLFYLSCDIKTYRIIVDIQIFFLYLLIVD